MILAAALWFKDQRRRLIRKLLLPFQRLPLGHPKRLQERLLQLPQRLRRP